MYNLDGPVRVPATVGVGTAQITIAFDAWKEGQVAASRHDIKVVAARSNPKLEPVSPRLKLALQHPNRKGVFHNLHYSPDGRRLIAGDYQGGVLQVWDTVTGKQLTKIETGLRNGHLQFLLAPDWSTLYVPRSNRKTTRFEKDGKQLIRWEFQSDVRSWDLSNGEPLPTLTPDPPRNIVMLQLSPDGSTFLTAEELPGEYDGSPPRAAFLRDVKTQQVRPLPDKASAWGTFAPDSRTVALTADDANRYATAVTFFDVSTAQKKLSIPISDPFTWVNISDFSLDGRLLMGWTQSFPAAKNSQTWDSSLKLWDMASGKEIASFALDEKKSGLLPVFSSDGRTVAATNWQGDEAKVFLFDLPDLKLRSTIRLGVKTRQAAPNFSPDGKTLAVRTQVIPEELQRSREPAAEDAPQPRIHLIDVAAGAIRETIVAPQGFGPSMCFSPDGKTLATCGNGKVLLWDLSKPLGVTDQTPDK